MKRVRVEVFTPVGKFTGYCSEPTETYEDACNKRDSLQGLIRQCDLITIFSDVDESEISLTEYVIKNSVFCFNIVDVE